MGESVGTIDLNLGVNQTGFNSQMNSIARNAESTVGGAFTKLGTIIAAAFAIKAVVGFGASCIELASNLNEVQNVVDVTFGNMSSQINTFSKNAITQFGLSEYSAKKFSSTIGAMMKSSGIVGQQLTTMSEGVTGLTGDLASFYNLNTEDAFEKIRAGISGETMPLKQLGINMDVANLSAFALKEGITTSYQKMDQASQTLLRYNYLLSVTKDAQGDFARTSGSWANQVRILSTQFDVLKGTLGQGFINMLTPVLQGLNWLILKLQVAAQYFQAFTEMLFGSAAASASAATASAMTSSATDGAAASADKAATAATKQAAATKAAAAVIKGSLAGFDQLNVLSKPKAEKADTTPVNTGGSAGLPAGMTIPAINVPAPKTTDFSDKLKGLRDIIDQFLTPLKNISFAPLIAAFDKLKEALAPLASTIWDGLKWAYFNLLVPLAKWTIEKVLPAFLDILSGCLRVLNPLLTAMQPVFLWLWNNFLSPIAKWTGGVIISVLHNLASALNAVGDWMTKHQTATAVITTLIIAFFGAWQVIKILSFIEASGGVLRALLLMNGGFIKNGIEMVANKLIWIDLTLTQAKNFVVGVGETIVALGKQAAAFVIKKAALVLDKIEIIAHGIAQLASNVATAAWTVVCGIATIATTAFGVAMAFLTSPIGLVVLAVVAVIAIGVLLYKNWDTVKEFMGKAFKAISDAAVSIFNSIGDFFTKWGGIIYTTLSGAVKTAADFVTGLFKALGKDISGVFNDVVTFFATWGTNIYTALSKAVKTAADFALGLFKALGKNISGVFNDVVTFVAKWGGIIYTALSKAVKTAADFALGLFKTLGKNIGGVFNDVVSAFKTWGTNIYTTLSGAVKTVADFITGHFKTMKGTVVGVFRDMVSAIGGVLGGIGNFFKGIINTCIDGINSLIRAINSIQLPSMDIPGIGHIGGGGLNIPLVPHLANGGLVSAPTLAMVGDNRGASADPEVVAPLSKLKAMLGNSGGDNREIVALLTQILATLKNQNGDIILKIGETEFGKIAIRSINSAQRQAGITLLTI